MKYNHKTGMFDLSDPKVEQTYDFSLKNTITGGRWIVNAVENELRAFCSMHGLRIEIYKSGWIFTNTAFVIKGSGTNSRIDSLKDKLIDLLSKYA